MREVSDGRLRYIEIRYLMTDLMLRTPGKVWTVKEFVAVLVDLGIDLGDRPSKWVSDLLRTEQVRGRAVRIGWGRYRLGHVPDTTRRRIQKRSQACRSYLADYHRQDAAG